MTTKKMLLACGLMSALAFYNLNPTLAQGLPKTQPKLLTIIREEVKVGMGADHAKHEAGWPAAYEKAKSPDYYLAMASMTGSPEVWYVVPSESHAQMGESMKREDKDPVLSAELARLGRRDAEFVSRVTVLNAIAKPDLSFGDFPELAKARFFEIGIYRLHPGQDGQFNEIAKTYAAARKRAAPNSSYRMYQVIAGMEGPTYLVFSSVESYAALDQTMADEMATFKGATPEEKAAFQKWGDVVISEVNHRFRLDPVQSYVPKETRAKDPEFWETK